MYSTIDFLSIVHPFHFFGEHEACATQINIQPRLLAFRNRAVAVTSGAERHWITVFDGGKCKITL